MAKNISLGAKIKDKLSVPADNKAIRIALMTLSGVLLLITILGIMLLLLIIYLGASTSSSDFDEGSSALMFAVALELFGILSIAQIMSIIPARLGYLVARKNTHIKGSLAVGIAWSIFTTPIPALLLYQELQVVFFRSQAKMLFCSFDILLPLLWTFLIFRLSQKETTELI